MGKSALIAGLMTGHRRVRWRLKHSDLQLGRFADFAEELPELP